MTAHDHRTYVDGCYRCELSRDEVTTTPADIIAATRVKLIYDRNHDGYGSNKLIEAPLGGVNAAAIVAALDAAGYDIVARDPLPATCPTCGSDDPEVRARLDMSWRPDGPCPDPWHGEG